MSLEGKKLLFLGGALFQVPALACAKRLGCHVILVDYDPLVPGRPYADVFAQLSTTDKENILELAKEHRIDGVMTYASDSSVSSVAYVAQQLHLPGNPPAAAEIIRRKDLFREFQQQTDLPHPRFFATGLLEEALTAGQQLEFPLVIKPVDSAGTKGQSIINTEAEIERAFAVAIEQSREKIVIFEEFIPSDIMELDGDIWFTDGRLTFRHYGHNHFQRNRISNVPIGEIFPAFIDDDLAASLDLQLNQIIAGLGLRVGCLNFDALLSNGKVYILDIGLRNGGNYVPDLIKLSTGFDLTEASIYSALGVEYENHGLYCTQPFPVVSYFMGSRSAGRFDGFSFKDEIKDYVVETRMFMEAGASIQPFTCSNLAAGIVFFKFPDMAAMKTAVENIEALVELHVSPADMPVAHHD